MQVLAVAHVREALLRAAADLMEAEWPPHYGPDGPGDALADLQAAVGSGPGRLPERWVALDAVGRAVLGVVGLLDVPVIEEEHERPVVAGLVVASEHRRRGIGAALVREVIDAAHGLGHAALYASGGADWSEPERLGFVRTGEAASLRGPQPVWRLDLG